MNNKPARIFEYVWLITAILALLTSIYSTVHMGVKESLVLYGLTIIASAMYYMRKYLRTHNKS